MKKITVKMVKKMNPCYDPTTVEGIEEGSKMTLLEAMNLKIDDADKVWLFSKFASPKQCYIFAIWCAKRCGADKKEIKAYIKAIEGYYLKKTHTKEDMMAAERPAYSAAYMAAERKAQVRKIKQLIKEV